MNTSGVGEITYDLPNEWKIMIVDDEPIIHKVISLAFKQFCFRERKVTLLHAFSCQEAIQFLERQNQIAVAIIDVLMEKDDSGLELVNYIRKELRNETIRIILKTSQANFIPPTQVVVNYDIQDYIYHKEDFSFEKLRTVVSLGLKTWFELEKVNYIVDLKNQQISEKEQLLETLLKKLELAQLNLLKLEKISTLGYWVASISHELNTPATVVLANIRNIGGLMTNLLIRLPTLISLLQNSQELQPLVDYVFRVLLNHSPLPSNSKIERERKRNLEQKLSQYGIEGLHQVISKLSILGVEEFPQEMVPFLNKPDSIWVLETLAILGQIKNNLQLLDIAAYRSINIIQTLKQFASFQEAPPALTDLEEHMEGILLFFKHIIPEGLTLVRDFKPTPPVPIVANQLLHVWANLINNAIQAMEGEGTLIIRIYPFDKQFAAVEVCDTGPGIAPENIPKLFEPFFTTKKVGEGMGIGLDFCKKIIEKHKGQIHVYSEPGNTIFRVLLPVPQEQLE
ncbi:MAG: ATP-binding protein [Bacteroidia bacterium]|nr:ATP-binding protein [Bacteroidia bacterium]MDW8158973.1 ATP-binding protein [Bacteroidia bacterium]